MRTELRLFRAHGLGNDYLVLEAGGPLNAELVRQICDRHTGVGSDGILEPRDLPEAHFGVTIWNPDGSIAEKSGNGLRIFAWWLHHEQGAPMAFTVSTGTDVVACEVDGDQVRIEMGTATQEPGALPLDSPTPWTQHPLTLGEHTVRVTAVSMGNPHAVVFVDEPDLDTVPWRAWGEALETHPSFPNRTNVQVAHVDGEGRLELRIWERGAGPTLASGSSSCATVVAAVITGRLDPGRHVAHMPGGTLVVTVGPSLDVVLEGPVEPICRATVAPSWLAAR